MISSVSAVLASFASTLRSRLDLVFEHLALSRQVMVLRRSRRRAQFSGADRCFWIMLSALWDRWPKSLMIAQPATVLRWRREGVWRVWRKGKGKRRPGWPPLDAQLVSLIGQMSRSNLLWGAPRIHGELLKLGLKVASGPEAGLVCNWEKLVEANEMRLASMAIRSGRDGFREQYGAQAWEDFITSNGLFINAFLN